MKAPSPADSPLESHEPHWVCRAAFPIISLALFSSQIFLGVAVHFGWIWLALPLVLIVSHLMHGQVIAFHEASHGLLRKDRRLNEIDGILIGAFSFMSFSLYRAVHQTHHAHLGRERDEELWPFVLPGMPRAARILAAFLELSTGIVYGPFLFLRAFLRRGSPIRSKRVRRRIWAELVLSATVWTVVFAAVSFWNVWNYFFWLYAAPAFIAGNLQSWRKYIEHVGLTGTTVNSSTRSIVADGWLGKLVALTLLHEPYHGVHHQRAGLPHATLPQHASVLQPATPSELAPYPSYRHALLHLIKSLSNPRVGAQWLRVADPARQELATTG